MHRARRGDARGRARAPRALEDQDRTLWDRALIAEADALIVGALRAGRPGASRSRRRSRPCTRGAELRGDRLAAAARALRRPAARLALAGGRAQSRGGGGEVAGPEAALAEVEALEADGRLDGYRYLPATKADLLRRLGATRRRAPPTARRWADRQRGRAGVPRARLDG